MLISVIMPVYNEAGCIERTLQSLLRQQTPSFNLEVVLVDGGSTDGSMEILERYARTYPHIQVLHNAHRKTPYAFNQGLQFAQGEYVCILGAHAAYPDDYIATCYAELLAHGAVGCSGKIVTCPANQSTVARVIAASLASPFASSRSSVRTQQAGFADTVAFPVFRKAALIDAGGYDVRLHRNQDNDMNQRLRAMGHRLWVTDKVAAAYHARPTLPALLAYAFTTGRWNALTLRYRRDSMRLRHFAPFMFVSALACLVFAALAAALLGSNPLLPCAGLAMLIAAHLCVGTSAAVLPAARHRDAALLLMPAVILLFHLAYGIGTASGLFAAQDFSSAVVATFDSTSTNTVLLQNGNNTTTH